MVPGIGPKTSAQVLGNLALAQDVMMGLRESRVPPSAAEDWLGFLNLV